MSTNPYAQTNRNDWAASYNQPVMSLASGGVGNRQGQYVGPSQTTQPSGQILGSQAPIVNNPNTGNNPPAPNPNPGPQEPQVYKTPEGWDFQGTQDQYMKEIDNAFNAGMNYWNTAQSTAEANKAAVEKQAETDYTANVGQLGQTKSGALGTLAGQERQGQIKKEDAMAAARRLYQELQMGNIQRFGGSTSAGGAASEIMGSEFQRQQGSTSRSFNEFQQNIEGQKNKVESDYQQGMLQLAQAKQQALTSIQTDFANTIAQIASGRAQTEQQKSEARLQALMNLRNQAFTIQQQDHTFQQQLTAMREQAKLNLETYNQTGQGAQTAGGQALTGLGDQYAGTNLQTSKFGTSPQTGSNPYVGQIGQTTKKEEYGSSW